MASKKSGKIFAIDLRRRLQRQVAADIRSVFNAPDRMTAEAHLTAIIYKYDNRISRLVDWACGSPPVGGSTYMSLHVWLKLHELRKMHANGESNADFKIKYTRKYIHKPSIGTNRIYR